MHKIVSSAWNGETCYFKHIFISN